MSENLRIAVAQFNAVVGDSDGNAERMLESCRRARDELAADLVVFPELAVCGYPPEDLLFHRGFRLDVAAAMERLCAGITGISAIVGYPEYAAGEIYNSAAFISDGRMTANYRKACLPNYGVFDEKRYFQPGSEACVVDVKGVRLAITICEDVWEPGPTRLARAAGASLMVTINGSPYDASHPARREKMLRQRILESGLGVVYANLVGGQDELVFDGASMALDAGGELVYRAASFEESLDVVEVTPEGRLVPSTVAPAPGLVEGVYRALVLGTGDYVDKHRFPNIVLGLSGGIDSALTLAVAVDALGPERVRAVMMPSRYTSRMSLDDAEAMARGLGIQYDVVSIEPIFAGVQSALSEVFKGTKEDVTEPSTGTWPAASRRSRTAARHWFTGSRSTATGSPR